MNATAKVIEAVEALILNLQRHSLHYSDQEAAAETVSALRDAVQALREPVQPSLSSKPRAWLTSEPDGNESDGSYGSLRAGVELGEDRPPFGTEPLFTADVFAAPPAPAQAAGKEPVAWREHVEQRMRSWRIDSDGNSGFQLGLESFMDAKSAKELIDHVCNAGAEHAFKRASHVELRDFVEEMLYSWRQQLLGGRKTQRGLEDFIDDKAIKHLIECVCDGWAEPMAPVLPQARPLSDELMDCIDRLGSEADKVDPRVWDHLLPYVPRDKMDKAPVALLWKVRNALARASAICDAVPTRQPGRLGELVNAQPDGAHGYREIQDAEEALTKYLTTTTAAEPVAPAANTPAIAFSDRVANTFLCLHGPADPGVMDSLRIAAANELGSLNTHLERECDGADELLRLLGLNPERCRTEGGALNLSRVRSLLADGCAEPAAPQAAPLVVTDVMVGAYLKANAEYWQEVDAMPQDATKPWRQGTPREATRVSLQAALAAAEREQPAGNSGEQR